MKSCVMHHVEVYCSFLEWLSLVGGRGAVRHGDGGGGGEQKFSLDQ